MLLIAGIHISVSLETSLVSNKNALYIVTGVDHVLTIFRNMND